MGSFKWEDVCAQSAFLNGRAVCAVHQAHPTNWEQPTACKVSGLVLGKYMPKLCTACWQYTVSNLFTQWVWVLRDTWKKYQEHEQVLCKDYKLKILLLMLYVSSSRGSCKGEQGTNWLTICRLSNCWNGEIAGGWLDRILNKVTNPANLEETDENDDILIVS